MTTQTEYALKTTVKKPYPEAVDAARDALAGEGFGILTEIDIKATMKEKLDAEFRPYVILGACNPPLAHSALSEETDIGLLLPCNVIVYEGDEPGTSVVAAIDPVVQLGVTGRREIEPVATEVRARLERVLESLAN